MNDTLNLVDEFRALVARASGNQQLAELLGQLRTKVRWVFAMDVEDRAATAWHDHRAVLDAILRGDADAARQLMDQHVQRDEVWFDHYVQTLGGTGPAEPRALRGRRPSPDSLPSGARKPTFS